MCISGSTQKVDLSFCLDSLPGIIFGISIYISQYYAQLFLLLLQARLRGKVDSNGCVAAFLEERLNMGLTFILSAEVICDLIVLF